MKIGIIGSGIWGRALSKAMAIRRHTVFLDMMIGSADVWLVCESSGFVRGAIKNFRPDYKGQPIIICAKGMEPKTYMRMSEILVEELPKTKGKIGVFTGPTFADEVARNFPSGGLLAGPSKVRQVCRPAFFWFYLEETDDIIGAEFCGIGKNAVAIVSGFYSIRAKGENERAMMVARAWREVVKIGIAAGAKTDTFIGIGGTGDLLLSATSKTSRNFSAGIAIARGKTPKGTVEGLFALRGLVKLAKKYKIDAPVLGFVNRKS